MFMQIGHSSSSWNIFDLVGLYELDEIVCLEKFKGDMLFFTGLVIFFLFELDASITDSDCLDLSFEKFEMLVF